MSRGKSWEIGSFAACLLLTAACANTDTGTTDQSQMPATMTGTTTPVAGKTGGAAGMKAAGGSGTSSAGSTGSAGTGAGASVTAMAIIQPFMMAAATTGAAGAGGSTGATGAAGSTATSGSAGTTASAAGKTGSTSAGGSGGGTASSAGAGGKKAFADEMGTGAGLVGVTGTATFTKSKIGVDLSIDISAGCADGKMYPVHIHQGTSCDSVMTQGGHWGAAMPLPLLENAAGSGAAGSGGSKSSGSGGAGGSAAGAAGQTATSTAGSGAAGHDASHAAGSGAAAAGTGAAGGGAPLLLRGEDIPAITCSGVSGKTSTTRSTPDKRLVWSIGTMDETDVVGHVIVVHDTDGTRIGCGKIMMK